MDVDLIICQQLQNVPNKNLGHQKLGGMAASRCSGIYLCVLVGQIVEPNYSLGRQPWAPTVLYLSFINSAAH